MPENASVTGFRMAGVGLGAIAMERVENDRENRRGNG